MKERKYRIVEIKPWASDNPKFYIEVKSGFFWKSNRLFGYDSLEEAKKRVETCKERDRKNKKDVIHKL